MKRFSEQLHKKSLTVKLQADEKRELRERLVSYMEYHPLPPEIQTTVECGAKKESQKQKLFLTDAFTTVSIPFSKLYKSSAVLAIFILMVIPAIAERAVPGDVLYAVKVQFNEELRSTLTFNTYQKVEWETERLNRRIAEARLLANEGRLTEEVEAGVAAAVKTHAENAKRSIAELRTHDVDSATIASIALDTTLEVQSASLRQGDIEPEYGLMAVAQTETKNLIAEVIDESRSSVDDSISTSTLPSYEKLMARVEQNTTRTYEMLNTITPLIPKENLDTNISRRLEDINRSINEAVELSETDEITARKTLVDVLQRTQRLIVYMTELYVAETIDIETLIPIILTSEEQQLVMDNLDKEIQQKVAQIETLSEQINDELVLEKIEAAQEMLGEQIVLMASSSDDFHTFQIFANEALVLANDTLSLIDIHSESVDSVEGEDEGGEVTATTSEPVIEDSVQVSSSTSVGGTGSSSPTEEVESELDRIDILDEVVDSE